MTTRFKVIFLIPILIVLFGFFTAEVKAQKKITTPESYFGFKLGTDRKIARWDKIVDYFYKLEKESDKIQVTDMGPSTMGHPFLVVLISSADNLANLDRLRDINTAISDPRGIDEQEIKKMIQDGKAVICQSMSLHATEIGGTQMAPELAYDLITGENTDTQRILEEVLFFMIPSFNPDGQIMVTDWYRKSVGQPHEGISLPWLYHKYVGHDNNRDGDFLSMVESKYAAKLMYVDWPPQAYIDHHHMGSYGARFYVPPYCEPIRPFADPLIWREISWYGAHIAYKLEEAGIQGVLNAAQYPGWGHFGWHWITPFHNIAGMLTESAGTQLATPIYIHPDQLRAGSRAFPEYMPQSTFPSPWPGGWWRLEDIVRQKKISAMALLDLAAKNRETVLWNAYLKAKHQTERGEEDKIKAVVIPAEQHDPLTAKKMINILLQSGVEIKKAKNDFAVHNRSFPKESYVVRFAQPKRGLLRNLLLKTRYADNAWTRDNEGVPMSPYDLATHTMFEFMGVDVHPVTENITGDFTTLEQAMPSQGEVLAGSKGYILDGSLNDSYRAVNLLLDKGISVRRLDEAVSGHETGDFIVFQGSKGTLSKIAGETGVNFESLNEIPKKGMHTVKRKRLGMYQRYYGGNMDEGWTRFLLEQFDFPYTTLKDAEILDEALHEKIDVIILPSDDAGMMTGDFSERNKRWISTEYPEEYKSGFGKDGVKNLKAFVKNGGTLVALAEACTFVIDEFELDVRNALKDLSRSEFFCPGSTIRVTVENDPLAYGMPEEGVVVFRGSPAFVIAPGRHNDRYKTIVRYAKEDLLESGWLIGEKKLAKKAGMVSVQYEKGQIILIGFRVQHRYQTHGTFKLLFNTIIQ